MVNNELVKKRTIIAGATFIIMNSLIKKKKQKRRWWITQLFKNRDEHGGLSLINDLLFQESGQFENFVRMAYSDFKYLVSLIRPQVEKKTTHWRKPISVEERLAVTLRFLVTGDSYTSLQYTFKISKSTISSIIPEICIALTKVLSDSIFYKNINNILFVG
ncbi:unnamed protein product [Macrosiphum euphorbiae]|uniref:DUF8040 domain-containing protein n=1 Tax=Macrosiphum euphorbiae TaxID=13131 RepID=A0AAV0Y6A9_9HEMI|nr:unnamed protein product [Macrosiphum euphorbiae]